VKDERRLGRDIYVVFLLCFNAAVIHERLPLYCRFVFVYFDITVL